MKGTINSVKILIEDYHGLGSRRGTYNWWNIVFFDPLHILGDTTVIYEMCNVYEDLDKLTGIFSLDYGLLAQQMT